MKVAIFFLTAVFFVIYFKLFGFIYQLVVPWNTATDLISIFLILVLVLPASYLSAIKAVDVIKGL